MTNSTDETESTATLDDKEESQLIEIFRTMQEVRRFEETVDELTDSGEVPGSPHLCIGQEAIAAGVCAALETYDFVGSTWRGHGHLLAKGVELAPMLAEIAGRESGLNSGRAGTMHMADLSVGAIGQNGIVGASASHIAGATLSAQIDNKDRVGAAFFSDGALNEGIIPETMNLAAIWDLPMLLVCENNQYAVSTPASYSVANHGNITDRAEALNIPAERVDGQDVLAVYEAARDAVDRARSDGGPSFIECRTYRYSGHFAAEDAMLGDRSYRSETELQSWKDRDPVELFADRLLDAGILSQSEREEIEATVETTIEDALTLIDESTQSDVSSAYEGVYADSDYANFPSEGYR